MLAQCLAAITQAAGRPLTKAETDGIEERMLSSMQSLQRADPAGWRSMGKDQRYAAAAKMSRERYGQDVAQAQARTVRDAQTQAQQLRLVDSFKPGAVGQLAALRQRLTMQGNYKGGDIALEAKIQGVRRDFTRELDGGAVKGKFWNLVQDPTEQHNLVKAIYGEPTGNPKIDALGKQVQDVLERARVTANDAGVPIHYLDNWHLPQPWAWERIGANPKGFADDMMANIDHNSYVQRDGTPMNDAQIRKLVEASAETLGTDGANKRGEGDGGGYGGSVGSSRNAPRQLHFKDADAYSRMMDKYGSASTVMAMLDHHFGGLARDIATTRTYGRSADRFVSQLIDRAFAADAKSGLNEKQLGKLANLRNRTRMEYAALRSPGHPGSLPLLAKISNSTRAVIGSTLLGSTPISALPDLAMATAYGREIGLTKRALLGSMAEGFKPTEENLTYIRRLGIAVDTMQEGTERYGAGELSNQFTRFLNHGVHVASLLRMWDRTQTHGFSASLMDLLGSHVSGHDYGALDPKDQAYLQSRGVTADHYATWQQAELEKGPHDNHTMLTPDSIYSIPDAKLAPIAEQRLGGKGTPDQVATEIRNLRSEAAQHLLATVLSETHIGARGATGNSIRDNVNLHITPDNNGTIMGQVTRWLLFLKQTPLGIFRSHMIDVPGGASDWKSAWAYRARYMAAAAPLGALSVVLKQMALGQNPDNLLTPEGAGKIAMASGGLGMYGDFLFGNQGDHQNNALIKLAGPGATALQDIYGAVNDTQNEALGEGSRRPGAYSAKMLKLARNYAMPFSRLWYAKAAFNHMVYQQQMEKLVPGYNARVRQRMARANQSSWWQQGDTAPNSAPSIGAAFGQQAQR